MAWLDSQFLRRLEHLALVAKRVDGGLLARPRVRLAAGGTELTGHRDYAVGDDLRQVDWNICARHDELMVKQFQGEADHHTYVLLDVSGSMALGRPPKFDAARRAAAAVAYVALAKVEKVGLVAFSDRIVADLPPLREKSRMGRVIRFLNGLDCAGERTDLTRVATTFVRRHQRHGLAVVISDWYDPGGIRRGLDILRKKGYLPRVVNVFDPADAEPGAIGETELSDVETGATWEATINEKHLAAYRELYDKFRQSIRSYCDGYGLWGTEIACNLDEEELLLKAVGIPSCCHQQIP